MGRKVLSVCCFILAALNIAVIFALSGEGQSASNSRSQLVTSTILNTLDPERKDAPVRKVDEVLDFFHPIIRKAAHFTEYASLGFLTCLGFLFLGLKPWPRALYPSLICLITAMSDELYQSTVPGRSPMVTDVMLDVAGGIAGVLLVCLIHVALNSLSARRRSRPGNGRRRSGYRSAPGGRVPPI